MKVRPAAELLKDFATVKDIFLEMPPYQRYTLEESTRSRVAHIENFRGTFDCYCVSCKKESTFVDVLSVPGNPPLPPPGRRDVRNHSTLLVGTSASPPPLEDKSFTCRFVCTRNKRHTIEFHFRVQQGCLLKIGQFPSMMDLKTYGYRKYQSILGDRYRELTKAAGLFAHGLGIGSFVYLRRIFERLITEAHQRAAQADGWDDSQWKDSLRIEEKIRLLRSHLPAFLAENRSIYAVLSKGIHELSEEECLRYFPVIRESIEAILDEQLAERASIVRRKDLARELDQITADANTKNVPKKDL